MTLLLPLMTEICSRLTENQLKMYLEDSRNDDIVSIEEQVTQSDLFKQSEGLRAFEYKLNEKNAKSKLRKGTKRIPFLLEENSSSSNLIFSVGAWKNCVLPAVGYWKAEQNNKKCKIND